MTDFFFQCKTDYIHVFQFQHFRTIYISNSQSDSSVPNHANIANIAQIHRLCIIKQSHILQYTVVSLVCLFKKMTPSPVVSLGYFTNQLTSPLPKKERNKIKIKYYIPRFRQITVPSYRTSLYFVLPSSNRSSVSKGTVHLSPGFNTSSLLCTFELFTAVI